MELDYGLLGCIFEDDVVYVVGTGGFTYVEVFYEGFDFRGVVVEIGAGRDCGGGVV